MGDKKPAKVGDNIVAENASWSFDEIADNFDEHVKKSVPLYNLGHELVCQLSDFFIRDDSKIYELGCSTGTIANMILTRHKNKKNLEYIGIDAVAKMVALAAERNKGDERAQFIQDDVVLYSYDKCSLVISYYTIQFLSPAYRQDVFNKIYSSLEWGGALLFFEKVRGPDARFQDIYTQLYQDFKLERGFSEEEIVNKSRSLKGVLEPFSTQGNMELMKRAGFVDISTIMKYICFEGFLAIK